MQGEFRTEGEIENRWREPLPLPASVWSILIYRHCQAPNNGRGKGDGLQTGSNTGVASGKSRLLCQKQERGVDPLTTTDSLHPPDDSGRTEFLQEDPACSLMGRTRMQRHRHAQARKDRIPRRTQKRRQAGRRTDENKALINAVQSQHAVALPAMGAVMSRPTTSIQDLLMVHI